MKQIIKNIPLIGPAALYVYRTWINPQKPFQGSENYWKSRYQSGGNSGDGSYNLLAAFKADIINAFVADKGIRSVIEYGCGDGNQLGLARYPSYTGFDVSHDAIAVCRQRFAHDNTKTFKLMEDYAGETADLTLSLDVIYHLVEDPVFVAYMNRLFDSSANYVIVYSSDTDDNPEGTARHVRHRAFSAWVKANRPGWKLLEYIPNQYPFDGNTQTGSFANFYIYSRV